MHQVMTATRTHRNANPDYHEAALDELEILNKDGQREQVKAAAIIAVGVGAEEGMTRLALDKARHVDVDRKWFMTHHPKAGAFYVQHADGKASVVGVEHVASGASPAPVEAVAEPAPNAELAAAQARIAELEAKLAEQAPANAEPTHGVGHGDGTLPTAEDLDAVAGEQAAAKATSHTPSGDAGGADS